MRIKMPIRKLIKNGKPYAYMWGWHGHTYLISKFGVKGAREKALKQAQAAHASGWKE